MGWCDGCLSLYDEGRDGAVRGKSVVVGKGKNGDGVGQ